MRMEREPFTSSVTSGVAGSLGKTGAVQIATTGTWMGKTMGLEGMPEPNGNHAKVGVSTGTHAYAIFGDMNQQGSASGPNCGSSQNGRGGLFYVVDNADLSRSLKDLIKGGTAPSTASKSSGTSSRGKSK